MPAGEHRLLLAGGVQVPNTQFALVGEYFWGITNELQFQLPLVLTYGGPVADNLELRGRFGVVGIGLGATQTSKYYRKDPRFSFSNDEDFYSEWVAGGVARTTLGPYASLVFGVDAFTFVGGRFYRPGVSARGELLLDLGDRWSFSVGLSGGLGVESPSGFEDRQFPFVALGAINPGLDGRPTLAYHLLDQLDVVVFLVWSKALEAEEGVLHGTAGLDWHFD